MVRPTRAALYSRVSTDDQATRGTSLPDQLDRTTAYCQAQDWQVIDLYADDGYSGATTDRRALQAMLLAAKADAFDVVVVTDPDRLSRDLVDGLIIERELARVGVEVVYLVQPSMGTLERQLRGVIAEEERRKIRDRTSRGLRAVARDGHWPGGQAPYGYRLVRDFDRGRTRALINEQEAETLRWMVAAFVDDSSSTASIAADLNARSVPTASTNRKIANRATGRWTHAQVRFLLSACRATTGTWTYRTSTGAINIEVPAIMTAERYEQLQRRVAETSTGKGSTTRRHPYLLGGRITSPCGFSMHGMTKPDGTNRVYRCGNSTYERGPDRCDCQRVSADAVEQLVWDTIRDALTEPARLLALAGLATVDQAGDNREDLASIERRIRRLERALGTEIATLLESGRDATSIGHAAHKLEDDLNKLRQHRDRLVAWSAARQDRVTRAERVARLAESARAALASPSTELQLRTIALLDINVRVTGYEPCPQCEGRGLVPRSTQESTNQRYHTGDMCPTCRRYKKLPTISINGLLPDIDTIAPPATPAQHGTPFTIRPPSLTGT
jgi:site-specific DNA recombinase